MSAFVVSDSCMQYCVSALNPDRASCEDADRLGRELFELNEKAVAYRYGHVQHPAPSEWRWKLTCPMMHARASLPADRQIPLL